MNIKMTTLIENNPDKYGKLCYEHGLSIYIETDEANILFDTGQTGIFLENAKELRKEFDRLDYLIVSHGHYDHSGGVKKSLELMGKDTKMIVSDKFFKPKYKLLPEKMYKFNGNSFTAEDVKKAGIELIELESDMYSITENIMLFHNFSYKNDFEKRNPSFFIKQDEKYVPDYFYDEVVLGIRTDKGMVVVAGCSHVGIINILTEISARTGLPVYMVAGGTHLMAADDERIDKTIEALRKFNIRRMAVSHCTGEKGIERLKAEYGERFIYNNTGNVIKV